MEPIPPSAPGTPGGFPPPQAPSSPMTAAMSQAGGRVPGTFMSRLHRYKLLVKKFWWILLFCTAVGIAIQAYKIAHEVPNYASTARLMINTKINVTESSVSTTEVGNYMETQIALMTSQKVYTAAINALKAKNPGFVESDVRIDVHPLGSTPILIIRAMSSDAQFAKDFLQADIDAYIALQHDIKVDDKDRAIKDITDELTKAEATLQTDEDDVLGFQKANNIVFLQEQGSSLGSHLAQLNNQLVDRRNEYDLLVKLTAKQGDLQGLPVVAGASNSQQESRMRLAAATTEFFKAQQKAQERITELETQMKEEEEYLRPAHPKRVALAAQIADLKRSITLSKEQNIEEANVRRETLALEIQHLEAMVKEYEPKAISLGAKLAEFERLKSKRSMDQSLYESLLQSVQKIDLNRRLDEQRFTLMEPPSDATSIKDQYQVRLLSAGLGGLIVGMAILFIIDRFDDRINSTTELRDYFSERILGQMPFEVSLGDRSNRRLIQPGDDRHTYSESFRNLRSALMFMEVDGARPRTILFTSASPDEGKTTVATNFAITLAMLEGRVLLVDADLRRGGLNRLLDIDAPLGFTDVLLHGADWRKAVVPSKHKNLSVMVCGKYTSQGAELFLSPITDGILREMYNEFDYIIFDTSPVMAADDATSLAPKIDGTIFVLRASMTSARAARNALDQLYHRQVNVLGLVLNSVNALLPDYYYYYRYYEYYRPKDEVIEGAPGTPRRGKDGSKL
ncbi:capsular exopolysaccharide family [Verrucomicrobium sp. GAS474]|uniref:GumC family protein n=1 Tax=Verrucomicrobium sp. GAS474 TaxID=1882831 RepID=UPI00087DCA32|nr:polysaccharide biosynthesis tyrosine autokinase [Verrucomicrobium sp. GAS474]SDT86185.1 capsular exopolysaccharide family [Verrucomicrobium sp. GAS474]